MPAEYELEVIRRARTAFHAALPVMERNLRHLDWVGASVRAGFDSFGLQSAQTYRIVGDTLAANSSLFQDLSAAGLLASQVRRLPLDDLAATFAFAAPSINAACIELSLVLGEGWPLPIYARAAVEGLRNFSENWRLFEESLGPARRLIEDLHQPGTFFGDQWLATNSDFSDDERLEALSRLATRWYRRPLHPRRWRLAAPELARRAQECESTVEVELVEATMQALLLAFSDVGEETPIDDCLRVSRAAVANRLMEDLVGPGWRRRSEGSEVTLADDADELLDELELEYQVEVQELIRQLLEDLPGSQQAALVARLEGRPLTNAGHQALYRLRQAPPPSIRFLANN